MAQDIGRGSVEARHLRQTLQRILQIGIGVGYPLEKKAAEACQGMGDGIDEILLAFEITPQTIGPEHLKKAEEDGAQVTDDCSAVERTGMRIKIVEGDERNLKVTTPMDLKIAELLLEETQ